MGCDSKLPLLPKAHLTRAQLKSYSRAQLKSYSRARAELRAPQSTGRAQGRGGRTGAPACGGDQARGGSDMRRTVLFVGCVGCWWFTEIAGERAVLRKRFSHAAMVVAGDGALGQLGHGGREHVSTPRHLPLSDAPSTRVTALACGSLHTLLLGSDDVVYACGHSLYGQVRAQHAARSTCVCSTLC